MTAESLDPDLSAQYRTEKWSEWDSYDSNAVQSPREELPTGTDLPRKDWVTLNRARAKVGKTASSLHKWNITPTSECPCGELNQTMQHILTECTLGPVCTDKDLIRCNRNAKTWISHWRDKTWWWWSTFHINMHSSIYIFLLQLKSWCWLY